MDIAFLELQFADGRHVGLAVGIANKAFLEDVEMRGFTEPAEAELLMSIMSQIYVQSSWQYPQVIEFVKSAEREGRLQEVIESLGLQ